MTKNDANKITIACYGGCGRTVTLRKSKVSPADYYLCNSRESGKECESKLPSLPLKMIRVVEINAAASFIGYTDQEIDREAAVSLFRAKSLLERAQQMLKEQEQTPQILPTPEEVLETFIDKLQKLITEKESTNRGYLDMAIDAYFRPRLEHYQQLREAIGSHVILPQKQPFPEYALQYTLLDDEQKYYQLEISFTKNWGKQIALWEAMYTDNITGKSVAKRNGGWQDERIDVLTTLEYMSYDISHIDGEDEQLLLSEQAISLMEKRFEPGGDLFVDIAFHLLPYQTEY